MKAPVESARSRRTTSGAKGQKVRRLRWRRSLTNLWADVRRHPALTIFVSGYVAIFFASWWCHFFLLPKATPIEAFASGGSESLEGKAGQITEWVSPDVDLGQPLLSPRPGAIFGTDRLGTSVLTRLLRGSAETLSAALVGSVMAVGLGFCAVFFAGWIAGQRGYESLRVGVSGFGFLPAVVIAWWLSAALQPGFGSVVAVIALSGSVAVAAGLARAFAEAEDAGHVTAAQAAGFSRFAVLRNEVLPFVSQRLVSYGAMLLPGAVLLETALSFVGFGLGVQSNNNWGRMIAEGRSVMFEAPWLLLAPGLVIAVTVGWLSLTARSIRRVTKEKDFLSLV
jgi:peptide/nickel transport system permease protein